MFHFSGIKKEFVHHMLLEFQRYLHKIWRVENSLVYILYLDQFWNKRCRTEHFCKSLKNNARWLPYFHRIWDKLKGNFYWQRLLYFILLYGNKFHFTHNRYEFSGSCISTYNPEKSHHSSTPLFFHHRFLLTFFLTIRPAVLSCIISQKAQSNDLCYENEKQNIFDKLPYCVK